MAIELKKALDSYFKKNNLKEKIEQHNIHIIWEELAGKKISNITKVEKIKNNILFIKTKNSAWRSELTFQKEKLKKQIIEKSPNIKIKDIRFI